MKLKTRTNQPVYYKLPVSSNIQSLSDDLLNSLRVGDVVQKKTGNQKHCYIVTYKEEKHGICLSYFACGYTETISYDYTNGHWVFNSKDVAEIPSDADIKDVVESAESGTIQDALGLDSQGNLVKGSVSGGTKLYKHSLSVVANSSTYSFDIVTTSSQECELKSVYSATLVVYYGNLVSNVAKFATTPPPETKPYISIMIDIGVSYDNKILKGYKFDTSTNNFAYAFTTNGITSVTDSVTEL